MAARNEERKGFHERRAFYGRKTFYGRKAFHEGRGFHERRVLQGNGKSWDVLQKKGVAAILIAAVIMLHAGCGASMSDIAGGAAEFNTASDSYSMGGSSYAKQENGAMEEGAEDYINAADQTSDSVTGGSETASVQENRKLIKTVDLEVETRDFDGMMGALETRIQELGGYTESMDSYNGSSYSGYRSSRSAELKVRIPSGNLDSFLKTVAEAGNIIRRNENVDDVTLSYVDMESRRDTLRTEQSRLLELLDRAENIEEIITIEERLSEVRYQLESMESKLRTMDNLIDYSTVYINVSEVKELTPVEEPTVWERISEGFGESLVNIGHGVLEFGIWFLVNIPYLAIWGGIIAAVVLFIRRRRRKKRRMLEEQMKRSMPEGQLGEEKK